MYSNEGWPFENSAHAASVLGYDANDDGYWVWLEGEAADADLDEGDDTE